MGGITRRNMLAGSAVATAAGAAPPAAARAKPSKGRAAAPGDLSTPRDRLKMDFGWRFHLGHADDPEKDFGFGRDQGTYAKAGWGTADAAKLDFDDKDWDAIDLPHDWAVTLPFVPSNPPPPAGKDDPRAGHGFRPLGRQYPETSIGWYRKSFDIPAGDLGRRLTIEFDGAFRDALVFLNGYIVARNENGYTPFTVDLTDFANYGGKNVLTVRVDATLGEGWFYEGAGLYRHVWLVKTDPLHIPQWGTCVRSKVESAAASLSIVTELQNDSEAPRTCRIVSTVTDPAGRKIVELTTPQLTLGAHELRAVPQTAHVAQPVLWSVETPNLYRLSSRIVADGKTVDGTSTVFGIRTAAFDPEKGFLLNGVPVKLKGTCNHQDHAGVGAAVPDRIHEFRIARLKAMGSNAYRAAHNPPAPELLDACDRLGMLVLDETRRMSSDTESMEDLARMIRRDRNHPSIILWSIGNEEPQQGTDRGQRIAATMKSLVRELDPTRPITAAVDDPKAWGIGITPVLDVLGCNYRTDQIPAFHARMPGKPTIGTETASTVGTRGIYVRDPASGYCVAYDTEFPWWASTAEAWMKIVMPRPFIAGGFVWTGFDYRGEPTPFNAWPNVSSQFGILDACGFPKDNFHYYKAWWGAEPVLHLLPHWNWAGREGEKINVWCHSNLDRVELFLNGASQGVRTIARLDHAEWDVAYAPGVLEARGYKDGRLVLTDRRETTGAPARIALRADRAMLSADGADVAVVTAEIQDAQGRAVPTANDTVTFALSGPGAVLGVGNGDPRSHDPDKASVRKAFNGLCMALVQTQRTAGRIAIAASAPGLAPASLVVTAQPAPLPALI